MRTITQRLFFGLPAGRERHLIDQLILSQRQACTLSVVSTGRGTPFSRYSAAIDSGDLGYPALRFVAVQEYFVIVETDAFRFYYEWQSLLSDSAARRRVRKASMPA